MLKKKKELASPCGTSFNMREAGYVCTGDRKGDFDSLCLPSLDGCE